MSHFYAPWKGLIYSGEWNITFNILKFSKEIMNLKAIFKKINHNFTTKCLVFIKSFLSTYFLEVLLKERVFIVPMKHTMQFGSKYPTFNKLAQKSSQNRLIGLFLHVFPHELNPLFTMFLLERCFGVFSENLRMKKVFYSSGPTPGLLLKFFGESIVNFLVSWYYYIVGL